MEPRIIDQGPITLVGFSFFGDPFATSGGWTEENEIGRLWHRFTTYLESHSSHIHHVKDKDASYEVHIEHDETAEKGHYERFVGVEVEELEDVPTQLLIKILPQTTYAVFTLKGQQIVSDWSKDIFQEWMPGSGYQAAYKYSLQRYDRRFKGLDNLDESVLDVYVPISNV